MFRLFYLCIPCSSQKDVVKLAKVYKTTIIPVYFNYVFVGTTNNNLINYLAEKRGDRFGHPFTILNDGSSDR